MKILQKLTIFSTLFFTAVSVFADTTTNSNGNTSGPNVAGTPGVDITIQSLYAILAGIMCWATRFILILIVMFMIWYGYNFLSSRGDSAKFGKAKTNLGYGIVGIIIILGAYTIISTIGNGIQGIQGATDSVNGTTTKSSLTFNNFVPIDCNKY